MKPSPALLLPVLALVLLALPGCSHGTGPGAAAPIPNPDPAAGPPAGNPTGTYPVPAEGAPGDVSRPDHVIGTGTPESCTAEAFIAAVAQGGKITFNGGSKPFTITLPRAARVFNDKPDVVIDGGGLVTLSGGGGTRILYMNTCDPTLVWTTPHCDNQEHPQLTVQNLTFADGNASADTQYPGGGAIWVRGGRFKVVNCRFFNNQCASTGPDTGGGALRVTSQFQNLPVYLVRSTFGGAEGYGNRGANGGAISSIGVSWSIYNCLFTHNLALGSGGNPARPGTPGGGSGGAVYNDGNTMRLALFGSRLEQNQVPEYGSALFFVSNNGTGVIHLEDSTLRRNLGGSWYVRPGISMDAGSRLEIVNSVIE